MFATMIKIKALFSFLVAVYTTLPLFAQNLSYLQNVQSKIDSALTRSFAQQNTAPLIGKATHAAWLQYIS